MHMERHEKIFYKTNYERRLSMVPMFKFYYADMGEVGLRDKIAGLFDFDRR